MRNPFGPISILRPLYVKFPIDVGEEDQKKNSLGEVAAGLFVDSTAVQIALTW